MEDLKNVYKLTSRILEILLKDRSTEKNILWATDNYSLHGPEYEKGKTIELPLITVHHSRLVKPRTMKSQRDHVFRTRNMAEMFTPSWICNKQNNLVDEAWFGRKDVINTETDNPIRHRIGLLDRNLCIVSENTSTDEEWMKWAFKATYGYEFQGDNLLLARENLLFTFIDYYLVEFGNLPEEAKIEDVATIISWNLWQMDGMKYVVPYSCVNDESGQLELFDDGPMNILECSGCRTGNVRMHNRTTVK